MLLDIISFIHWIETSGLNKCSQGDAKLQWKYNSIPPRAMFGLEARMRGWSYKQNWLGIFQQNRSFIWHGWFIETKSVCGNMRRGLGWLRLTQTSDLSCCFLSISFAQWIFSYWYKMKQLQQGKDSPTPRTSNSSAVGVCPWDLRGKRSRVSFKSGTTEGLNLHLPFLWGKSIPSYFGTLSLSEFYKTKFKSPIFVPA